MISLPTDFTAPPVSPAPVLPTSSIAPKELIGNVNFPQLLGGFQASGATTKAVSGQEAPATKEPGLKASVSHVTQEFAARLPLAMQASGKAFPSSGTSLPLDQMAGGNGGADQGGTELMPRTSARLEDDAGDAGDAGLEPFTQQGFLAIPLANAVEGAVVSDLPQGGADQPMPEAGLRTSDKLDEIALKTGEGSGLSAPQSGLTAEPAPRVTGPTNADEKPLRSVPLTAEWRTAQSAQPPVLNVEQTGRAAGIAAEVIEPDNSVPSSITRGQAGRAQLDQSAAASELKAQTASFDTGVKAVPVPIRMAQPTAQPDVGNRANAQQDGPPQSSAGAVAGVGAGLGARPDISLAKLAQLPVQTLPMPRADMSASRLAAGPDLRVQTDPSVKRSATGVSDVTQGLAANPLQPAVLNLGESDGDAELTRAAPPSAPSAAPQSSGQSSGQTPASGLQVAAAPINAQPSAPLPMTDTSAALRLAPQLADAIEQLAETRSAAQANKPELTLRHQEFGAITMRLDTTGGDLRATLSARDPGFVPAIQAALFERAVAMSGEAATAGRNNDQTGSNSQSQGNSQSSTSSGSQGNGHGQGQGQGQGQGWNSGAAYGSSTGSGQGTSQPYAGQTENRDEESGLDAGARTMGRGDGSEGEGEIFA